MEENGTAMQLFQTPFDVYSSSTQHGHKERNGDSLVWRHLEAESIVLLVVADGVGSHRCDWLASSIACRTAMDSFQGGSGDVAERLSQSVLAAHTGIRNAQRECAGMMSTIVAVAWEMGSDRIWYTSAGDSRIYRFTACDMQQLTQDDRGQVLVRVAGELVLGGGMPVFARGLTRALGQQSDLDVNIAISPFQAGESLLLATDGMHGNGAGAERLSGLLNLIDLTSALTELVSGCRSQFEDDATALVLRRNDLGRPLADYENALDKSIDYRTIGLFGHLVTALVAEQLAVSADLGDVRRFNALIDYSEKFLLRLPREALIKALESAINSGARTTALRLKSMIRLSS
jgi:serine/threonine protein phosphatase PrpC